MATGTGPCRSAPAYQSHQSPDKLGEDDLNVVLEALHPVAAKYLFLGVAMNVKMNEIKKIQKRCSNHDECLLEVLLVRLKQIPSLTWRDIDAALRSEPVGEVRLANRIREKYGHLYPSSQASLDHQQGKKITEMTKNPTMEEKKEMKHAQKQEIDEEVSESERHRKPSEKLEMDSDSITTEAVIEETQPKAKVSPYTKRYSELEKDYEREMQPEGKTEKATHDKEKGESEVVDRHKVVIGEYLEQIWATGTDPCRSAPADQGHQSPDELGEDDLKIVLEALHPVSGKYMFLGVAMNVKMKEIKKIQKLCSSHDECLLEVLSVRLKQIPRLTWRDIDAVLRSELVGEVRLANRIREKYGHLYPSSQASLDHQQGKKITEMTKNPTMEEKKEMKHAQKQEIDEEVSESERHRKPSEKLEMDSDSITTEAVIEETQPKAKVSPYTKRYSELEKDYEREMQPEGKTEKATHDKEKGESEVVERHKVVIGEYLEQIWATETDPCRSAPADQSHQSPDELGEDDLKIVLEALHPVSGKYMFLGVAMNVKMKEIKKIQKWCSSHDECLLEVLSVRLKQIPRLTWRDIDAVLRSEPVGEVRLANRIREKYGHLYPSSQASLDHQQGKKITEMTKNPTMEEKKEMKHAQKQEIDEEVSESERCRKPSEKLEMDSDSITNEAVVKETQPKAKESPHTKRHSEPGQETQPKAKESPHTKRHSEPGKDYERKMQHEGKTKKTTDDKGKSEVVDRHKVITGEYLEQRTPKEVQKAAKSESIASSSEGEVVTDDFETAEGAFSSEQEEEYSAEEHDIQPKKRSRRRHRESRMSPTPRGSSSPSTSQEENRKSKETTKPKRKGRKKKEYVKKTKTKEGLSSSTETDNSSPECDMLKNISETESKGLRKVFKRFFSRLCFTIKAPMELATRLQMKGLLTYSVMNELLTSPESTQAKTITLVRALQKQIKSRPDRMFSIIQVFLHDEVLQQTGREIWTEAGKYSILINGGFELLFHAGKICPERSAFMFGSELPLPGRQATNDGNP